MEKRRIRPYGFSVLGQWKRKGNVKACKHIKTVLVCTSITKEPPGKQISILYQESWLVTETGIRRRNEKTINVAMVGTDASIDECKEWIKTQEVIEVIDVETAAKEYYDQHISSERKPFNKVVSGTYDIDNKTLLHLYEVEGFSLHELARKYDCTYHNLYNRIRRYKKNNDLEHVVNKSGIDCDVNELIHQREVQKLKYHELAKIYNCSGPSIRLKYIRAKERLTSKT